MLGQAGAIAGRGAIVPPCCSCCCLPSRPCRRSGLLLLASHALGSATCFEECRNLELHAAGGTEKIVCAPCCDLLSTKNGSSSPSGGHRHSTIAPNGLERGAGGPAAAQGCLRPAPTGATAAPCGALPAAVEMEVSDALNGERPMGPLPCLLLRLIASNACFLPAVPCWAPPS